MYISLKQKHHSIWPADSSQSGVLHSQFHINVNRMIECFLLTNNIVMHSVLCTPSTTIYVNTNWQSVCLPVSPIHHHYSHLRRSDGRKYLHTTVSMLWLIVMQLFKYIYCLAIVLSMKINMNFVESAAGCLFVWVNITRKMFRFILAHRKAHKMGMWMVCKCKRFCR